MYFSVANFSCSFLLSMTLRCSIFISNQVKVLWCWNDFKSNIKFILLVYNFPLSVSMWHFFSDFFFSLSRKCVNGITFTTCHIIFAHVWTSMPYKTLGKLITKICKNLNIRFAFTKTYHRIHKQHCEQKKNNPLKKHLKSFVFHFPKSYKILTPNIKIGEWYNQTKIVWNMIDIVAVGIADVWCCLTFKKKGTTNPTNMWRMLDPCHILFVEKDSVLWEWTRKWSWVFYIVYASTALIVITFI